MTKKLFKTNKLKTYLSFFLSMRKYNRMKPTK